MMKNQRIHFVICAVLALIYCFSSNDAISQQNSMFGQYLFNAYAHNPAFGGTSNCLQAQMGRREQWVGFDGAPRTTYLSISKAVGKQGFTNYWHGIGLYAEADKSGNVMRNDGLYPSYTYHTRVSPKYHASFGTFVGIRMMGVDPSLSNSSDPALSGIATSPVVFVMPDMSFGARLYSKKNFIAFSVKQILWKRKWKMGGSAIGSPSRYRHHYYLNIGKRIESDSYYYTFVPSMQIRFANNLPPSFDASFMMYVKDDVGFGVSYRYQDAVVALVQYKWKHFTAALTFELVTSKLRSGSWHSREYMLGYSSCEAGEDAGTGYGTKKANCPAYDF